MPPLGIFQLMKPIFFSRTFAPVKQSPLLEAKNSLYCYEKGKKLLFVRLKWWSKNIFLKI